jgi:hypothetical protein
MLDSPFQSPLSISFGNRRFTASYTPCKTCVSKSCSNSMKTDIELKNNRYFDL